jgi:hypothetical protein
VAAELIAVAGQDATLRARGHHAMARALLGQGRVVEALRHAQRALADNPVGDEAAEMAETLSRATRGEPYPQRPLRGAAAAPRAFAALAQGDLGAAASIAAASPDWAAARAGLVAASFRADPEAAVSYDALRVIGAGIDASAGAIEVDAVLWRVLALELREEAAFPTDTPPPLGPRLDRSELDRLVSDRADEVEPTIMREVPVDPGDLPTRQFAAVAAPPGAGLDDDDDAPIFPGTKIPRLSDYVQVMKAMRGADPLGMLSRLGLDMAGYAQLATQWGQRLADDPELSARFSEKMSE